MAIWHEHLVPYTSQQTIAYVDFGRYQVYATWAKRLDKRNPPCSRSQCDRRSKFGGRNTPNLLHGPQKNLCTTHDQANMVVDQPVVLITPFFFSLKSIWLITKKPLISIFHVTFLTANPNVDVLGLPSEQPVPFAAIKQSQKL